MMHKAWYSIEEVPYCFFRSSIKFKGHTGWKIDNLNPIWVRLLGRSQLSNPSDLPCFNIKRNILIHAPYTHIVVVFFCFFVLFDISIICPHRFHRVKFVLIPHDLYSSNICEILLYNCLGCYSVWADFSLFCLLTARENIYWTLLSSFFFSGVQLEKYSKSHVLSLTH